METASTSFITEGGESVTSFKIRIGNDLGDFAELWPRTDWGRQAHYYAFQCADVLQVWCDTVGKARGTRALFVAVSDDLGRPMLLLPLGIERQRSRVRILRFLDGGVCDYNAPVVFEPRRRWGRETLERLWRELIHALPRFDIAEFEKMPADVCGVPNPLIDLGVVPSADSGHSVSIASSWTEYVGEYLPYKHDSSYQRRRLAKLGRVVFKIAETPADRQRILQDIMRQKSRRYIETRGVDGLDRPGHRQYYITMTERFPWPGPLLIAALEVDGRILSAGWHLVLNERFMFLVPSFEGDEWKRFSPGRLLLEDLLQWSFSHEIKIFDFSIGNESYKLKYCNKKLLLYQANIPVTALGKAYEYVQNTTAGVVLRQMLSRGWQE